jgi:hypothetical protein
MGIKVNGKTVKAKVRATRNALFGDEKYTGGEPVWDTERARVMDDATFDNHLRKSFYYYNYYFTQKDTKKYVTEWMKNSHEFTKEEIRAFERSADRSVPMTVHGLIMAHRVGMPLLPRHIAFIDIEIEKAITRGDANIDEDVAVEEKPKVLAPTIQDRLNEKTAEVIGELEGHYDEFIVNSKYTFKPYDFLTANNVPQSQLSKYETVFQSRFAELAQAFERADEQLAEAYGHYRAADYKRIMAFIDQILNDIIQYRGVKKATKKVRAPKSVSKEKIVAKLKYAREDKSMRLVSINPVDIVGAQELWVYNTKTRRLGKYVADSLKGPLNVKGTSIIGYDEVKSVTKTLRKPEERIRSCYQDRITQIFRSHQSHRNPP